ncbi:MAG: TM0996/MTH895 family glutaredoxin-like protein [Prolixibacteraceae bacterium]|nr:TM0996/MTH895 family glutaredoxin-like protein [Prolixibacteraceae bacterium]
MEIKILGTGCANCKRLEKNSLEAVKELGLEATVTKVEDYGDIMQYGILRTPGFVLDEKVLTYGKILSIEEIKQLLTK